MDQQKNENLLAVLSSRRRQNFKTQFKSVVLEGLEIFGPETVKEVYEECLKIYAEFIDLSFKKLNSDEQTH